MMKTSIKRLIHEIRQHRAISHNPFFTRWRTKRLSRRELELVAGNYGEWVRSFPRAIAALAAQPLDRVALSETARTLLSETGNGKPEKSHIALLHQFLGHLVDSETSAPAPLLDSTRALVRTEMALYGQSSLPSALGAQLALEWQAYDMIVQLYEGARLYMSHWPSERAFHESAEYFHVHLAEAEKEHQQESLIALETAITSKADFDAARRAALQHLDAIAAFWEGLASALDDRASQKRTISRARA